MAVMTWSEERAQQLVQCVLRRQRPEGGHTQIVSWVDPRFAEVGLEVTVDRDGEQQAGWFVMSLGCVRTKGWLWDHRSALVELQCALAPRPKRKNRPSSSDAAVVQSCAIFWE